jgi:hypothetical protein
MAGFDPDAFKSNLADSLGINKRDVILFRRSSEPILTL